DRALYIVGGFGGAAGAIAEMLTSGEVPDIFMCARPGTPLAALNEQLDVIRRKVAGADDALLKLDDSFPDIEYLARGVLDRWQRFASGHGDWPNGLTVEENLRLFRSTDPAEISYLVFEGLRRLRREPEAELQLAPLQLALYHGDITSVPQVDGY